MTREHSTEKYLTYRGEIKGVVGVGGTLAFVTVHPEGQPTGLYRLDADTLDARRPTRCRTAGLRSRSTARPSGWPAATGSLYEAPSTGGKPKPRGPQVRRRPPTALAPLADGRLAVLVGSRGRHPRAQGRQGRCRRSTCPSPGPAWRPTRPAAGWRPGRTRGRSPSSRPRARPSSCPASRRSCTRGPSRALLFEPDELRFLSAGADQKLLSTHARGKLEPEDKGRGNNHTDLVTALIWGPGDRLYSGSRDGTIKSWPRVGRGQAGDDQGRRRPGRRAGHGAGPRPPPAGRGLRRQHAPVLPGRRGGQDRRAVAPGRRRLRPGEGTSCRRTTRAAARPR